MKIKRNNNQIILYKKDKVLFISLEDILFIERLNNFSYIHTRDRIIEIAISLAKILESLTETFVRSHRSYIINKQNIKEITIINSSSYEVIYEESKRALLHKRVFNELMKG